MLQSALPEDLDDGENAELTELRSKSDLQRRTSTTARNAERLEAQVQEALPDGTPVLTGALRAKKNN